MCRVNLVALIFRISAVTQYIPEKPSVFLNQHSKNDIICGEDRAEKTYNIFDIVTRALRLFLIEIYLTYSIILVLGVQHNDSMFVS